MDPYYRHRPVANPGPPLPAPFALARTLRRNPPWRPIARARGVRGGHGGYAPTLSDKAGIPGHAHPARETALRASSSGVVATVTRPRRPPVDDSPATGSGTPEPGPTSSAKPKSTIDMIPAWQRTVRAAHPAITQSPPVILAPPTPTTTTHATGRAHDSAASSRCTHSGGSSASVASAPLGCPATRNKGRRRTP
jgi:hypothetical protein